LQHEVFILQKFVKPVWQILHVLCMCSEPQVENAPCTILKNIARIDRLNNPYI